MSERIRLTISVEPEVHAIFSKMAEASGMSLGKCMGDWLADTAEGAQFVAMKMVEARKAPKTVMREFQAIARGLVDAVDEAAEGLRSGQREGRAAHLTVAGVLAPPSSNTGGKVPGKTRRSVGGKGV